MPCPEEDIFRAGQSKALLLRAYAISGISYLRFSFYRFSPLAAL